VEADTEIGRSILAAAQQGQHILESSLRVAGTVPLTWVAVFTDAAHAHMTRQKLYGKYTKEFISQLRVVCRLTALVDILEWVQVGFSDRVHIPPPYSWVAIAPALINTFRPL
jgi:hypothetical protein